jgi:flagellar assembly factor FliW
MPASLQTRRFGHLDIPDEHLLELPSGLIGIPGRQYALLRLDDGPFVWLQSLGDPEFALPLCDPFACFADLEIKLADEDLERIAAADADAVRIWATIRATAFGAYTVNLRAPILVVGQCAWQVLNQAENAPLRAPLARVDAPTEEPIAALAVGCL